MSKKQPPVTPEEYQQIRIESRIAATLFVIFMIFFGAISYYTASKGARTYSFMSLGRMTALGICMRVFIPVFHRKAYLDLDYPTLKKTVPKGGRPSTDFLIKQVLTYLAVFMLLSSLAVKALNDVRPEIDLSEWQKYRELEQKEQESRDSLPSIDFPPSEE